MGKPIVYYLNEAEFELVSRSNFSDTCPVEIRHFEPGDYDGSIPEDCVAALICTNALGAAWFVGFQSCMMAELERGNERLREIVQTLQFDD